MPRDTVEPVQEDVSVRHVSPFFSSLSWVRSIPMEMTTGARSRPLAAGDGLVRAAPVVQEHAQRGFHAWSLRARALFHLLPTRWMDLCPEGASSSSNMALQPSCWDT